MLRGAILFVLLTVSIVDGSSCPALSGWSRRVRCSLAGNIVDCQNERVPLQTVASLECLPGFVPPKDSPRSLNLTCLARGWRPKPFKCTQDCGVRGASSSTLVAGGEEAAVGEFPWHVGVYRHEGSESYKQICGGTLISNTLVISAAHCFWVEATAKKMPTTLFKVAAGKHLRAWSETERNAQVRDVIDIKLPPRYRGRSSNLQYDIAVVQLVQPVVFTDTVRPVCIDWLNQLEPAQLYPGVEGTVAGWGITHTGSASVTLRKTDLPYVDFDKCFNSLPEGAAKLYTDDKFCAGHAFQNISVCPGDSGGGLVFNTSNRYYLRGVASIGFRPWDFHDQCYWHLYTGFTLVSRYLDWLKTFDSTAAALSAGCPALESLTVNVRFSLEGVDVDCSSEPVQPGTIARLACRPGYAPKGNNRDKLITSCGVNRWRPEPIACELDCGRRGGNSRPLRSIGRKKAQRGEFPWHVAVYTERRDSFHFICGGTLVTRKFFISAAKCFWDAQLKALNDARKYRAILGKHTNEWQTQDEHEQRRSINAVHVPERFTGLKTQLDADIALVELSAQADMTPAVSLVCLDLKNNFEYRQLVSNSLGIIPGWGTTKNNTLSRTLRHVELPFVPHSDCLNSVPEDYRGLLLQGTFCSGFVNRSTSICPGDGGGGLVFPDEQITGLRYYLRGVASTAPRPTWTDSCAAEHVSVYTKISAYADWLEDVMLQQESGEEY